MTGDMYGSFNMAKARVEAPGLRAKAVATIARDFDDDLRDRYAAISTDAELEAEHEAEHQAARAQLKRCARTECPVCHPRDGHLWRDASGSRRGWRLVYGPDDLATASVGAQHAQAAPLLREQRLVPPFVHAVASDGQVYYHETRPGCRMTADGVIRIEAGRVRG